MKMLAFLAAALVLAVAGHGHVHRAVDFRIGRTRVLANPRGCDKTEAVGFRPGLVVEV